MLVTSSFAAQPLIHDRGFKNPEDHFGDALATMTKVTCKNCDVDDWKLRKARKEIETKKKWKDAGFLNPTIDTWFASDLYEVGAINKMVFTHQIKLTAVVFKDTSWSMGEVKQRFRKLTRIYGKCGIQVTKMDVIETHYPNDWVDPNEKLEQIDGKIATMVPQNERPIFFYTKSNRDKKWAYSYYSPSAPKALGKRDTAWITSDVKTPEGSAFGSEVSTEAHELAHILTKSGHVKDEKKNILAEKTHLVSDEITPDQCRSMKKHSSVQPISRTKD